MALNKQLLMKQEYTVLNGWVWMEQSNQLFCKNKPPCSTHIKQLLQKTQSRWHKSLEAMLGVRTESVCGCESVFVLRRSDSSPLTQVPHIMVRWSAPANCSLLF